MMLWTNIIYLSTCNIYVDFEDSLNISINNKYVQSTIYIINNK